MNKQSVAQEQRSKRIKYIQFGVMSPEEIHQLSELEIWQKDLYNIQTKSPAEGGVLDRRLGSSNKDAACETCHKKLVDCVGHFGHIRLALPVFHAGYLRATIQILQQICKNCARVMMEERDRRAFLKKLRSPHLDNPQKMKIVKQVSEVCRKFIDCPFCGSTNGVVKKVGVLKIIHEPYRAKSKVDELHEFRQSFRNAIDFYPDVRTHITKAQDDLNPLRVLELFKRIPAEDCELLGLDPTSGRPEQFIWQFMIVPPVCIRPSVAMDRGDAGSNEDDLTVKLAEIITINSIIQSALEQGDTMHKIAEEWEFLQIVCAQFVNSEMPGLTAASQAVRWIRGICQRLKGKQGRFRGNLSGKRVDFSGRTVISPDPNLSIDQVAVPEHVAKILTYPEVVNQHNIEKLRKCIINGADIHPGANYFCPRNGMKRFLKFVADRETLAKSVRIGDMVERHLSDGDIALFNRQPSLHKLSIMAHFVKVKPWRTFRFNECVCTPYNADFDGDEMNLHVPQTEEARAEAIELMGVKNNLVTPRNGQPLIAATQDFITGAYLMSRKDTFLTRDQFCHVVTYMTDASVRIDVPPPTIIKPVQLWTGKQIISLLLRPSRKSPVSVNLETKNRSFLKDPTRAPDLCPNEGWVVIHNSEVLCGAIDKALVGDGNKESMFYVVLRDFGSVHAAACMNRIAKLCSRWMGSRGFSIGIDDVTPGERLSKLRDELINEGYKECDKLIQQYKTGTLKCQPGCDMSQTLEAQISGKLSRIRDDLGQICLNELNKYNAPLIMSLCGSKGSKINVCQMVACVGQQIISGSRIADGFDDRTLPHFKKHSRTPAAKGFVRNSFYTGLTPTEFIFHAASGREGLVDTAVKTAETGYMQRRLMKALEDLAIQYDYSVRNSAGTVVQFDYGSDRLDPTMMEGDDRPIEFKRNFLLSQKQRLPGPKDKILTPSEIMEYTRSVLESPEFLKACSEILAGTLEDFVSREIAGKLSKLEMRYAVNTSKKAEAVVNKRIVNQLMTVTKPQLDLFFDICKRKFHRARIEPGTAVGALGAQSIGEPGTQMTLKTFHFAGVASMNVTLGVPRIKEIINASKEINTPIITAALSIDNNETVARIVKGRIETTKLGEIAETIEEVVGSCDCYVEIKISWDTINALQLEITLESICESITKAPKLKISRSHVSQAGRDAVRVHVYPKDPKDTYYRMQVLKRSLPGIVVKGIPRISRAVINEQEGKTGYFELLAEGYGLREVMVTDGVAGTRTTSNHIMEIEKVLGIEAARQTIIDQIQYTMGKHGMTIDFRHVMLLADIMTFKGEVLGITRFGIAKMKDSVLMLASFEKTTDHLFEAALYGKKDAIEGVSECIIMGIPMQIGTGNFKLLQKTEASTITPRQILFDLEQYHPPLAV